MDNKKQSDNTTSSTQGTNGSNSSNEKELITGKKNPSSVNKYKDIYSPKKVDLTYLESLYQKDVSHGVAGSQNLGNTCFMNSSIQCLSNSIDLTAYFLSKEYQKDINKTNKLGLGGKLADSWYELLSQLWEKRSRSVNAHDFKVAIAKKAKMFSGFSQQDSNELMTYFLEYIGEDLNRITVKPYRELEEQGENEDDYDAAQRFWQAHLERNNSIITDLFTGQFKSTIQCPECKWVSKTYDPFNTLSLPLLSLSKRQNLSVFFLPKFGMRKTIKFSLSIHQNSLFGDLSQAIKTSHNLEADFDQLRFIIVRDRETTRLALPKDRIEVNEDDCFVFCCDTDTSLSQEEEIMNYPIYFSINGELSAHPRLISITKTMTHKYLKELMFYYARKFINLPIDQTEYENETKTLADEYTKTSDDLNKICKVEYERIFNAEEEEKEKGIDDFINNLPYKLYLQKGNEKKLLLNSNEDDSKPITDLIELLQNEWRFVLMFDKHNGSFRQEGVKIINQCRSMNIQQSQAKGLTLTDCLEYFQLTEQLGKDNEWYCKNCKKHQLAYKKMELFYLPKILIIHLKRFTSDRYHSSKIDTHVDFPINDLDMSNFVVGNLVDNLKYDLYAVSQHYGGCGGGHYTAICKNNGQWYSYDDSSVSSTSASNAVNSAAYVLFYRRKD